MAVTDTRLIRTAPTGRVGIGGVTSYITEHRVETDDLDDNIVTVANAIGTCGSTTYDVGSESDSGAVLKDISPKRSKKQPLVWYVTSNWGPLDPNDQTQTGRTDDGEPTDNPWEFADSLEFDTLYRMTEMWEATFQGIQPGNLNSTHLKKGNKYIVCNSATVVRDPPEQVEYPVPVYRITQYRSAFPVALKESHTNATNKDKWTYKSRLWDVDITAEPGTALCQEIDGGISFINGIKTARVTFVIAIDKRGWAVKLPDIGYERLFDETYDTGKGEWVDPEAANRPAVTTIQDPNGNFVRQPIPLDGFGYVLGLGQARRYLKWLPDEMPQLPFANLTKNVNPDPG